MKDKEPQCNCGGIPDYMIHMNKLNSFADLSVLKLSRLEGVGSCGGRKPRRFGEEINRPWYGIWKKAGRGKLCDKHGRRLTV